MLLVDWYPVSGTPLCNAVNLRRQPQETTPMEHMDTSTGNIPIRIEEGTINGDPVQTVNARDLHAFLEVGKMFAHWIKDRIEVFGFSENVDYVVFAETGNNPSGGRPAKEYAVTIDMAKELAMVERNEKGKQARQYFIACERKLKAGSVLDLRNPKALASIALQLVDINKELQGRVDELAPKADALDRIAMADGSLCITDAAKTLQVRPGDLFKFLRSHGWTYKRPGTDHDVAYQSKIMSGLMEHKTTTVYRSDGTEKITTQVRVTPKGMARLAQEFPPHLSVA